jgi:hypothetical protein
MPDRATVSKKNCDAQRSDVHAGHLTRLSATKKSGALCFPEPSDQLRLTEPFRQHHLDVGARWK